MLSVGQLLQERYHITAKLGEGGMGAVYRADDNRLDKECVVKEMLTTPDMAANASPAAEQFKREAQVLARLEHPNLPRVIDYFTDDGNNYLVMDFVDGQNLHYMIVPQGMPEATVLSYANQLLDALEYIHGKGVVHRDIKPGNIIVRPDGRVMLVDFGLVKVMTAGRAWTNTFMRGVGTPEYAPPEQSKGGTDQRSDIYSLGATLYHALTGRPPPDATDRSIGTAVPEIRLLNPSISAQTERVVMQALAMFPTWRWQNAAAMRAELGSAPEATVPDKPPDMPKTVVRPMVIDSPPVAPAAVVKDTRTDVSKRLWVGIAVGAVALVILLALALRPASEPETRTAAISAPTYVATQMEHTPIPSRAPTSTFIIITPTEYVPPTQAPSDVNTGPIGLGAKVKIVDTGPTGLMFRKTPARTGEKIRFLPEGSIYDVVGGPQNADGLVWWELRDPSDNITGWSAADYLRVVP